MFPCFILCSPSPLTSSLPLASCHLKWLGASRSFYHPSGTFFLSTTHQAPQEQKGKQYVVTSFLRRVDRCTACVLDPGPACISQCDRHITFPRLAVACRAWLGACFDRLCHILINLVVMGLGSMFLDACQAWCSSAKADQNIGMPILWGERWLGSMWSYATSPAATSMFQLKNEQVFVGLISCQR